MHTQLPLGHSFTQKSATQFGAFAAASSKFALVWEAKRNTPTSLATAHLQQFDGARWTTKLELPQNGLRAMLSVASPTCAVSVFVEYLSESAATLVTHTWNGASWAAHTNATATWAQLFNSDLHALDSGAALLRLRTRLWRLG